MFIDNSLIQNRTGNYKVCVRQMHFEELNEYEDVSMLPTEVPGKSFHGTSNLHSLEHHSRHPKARCSRNQELHAFFLIIDTGWTHSLVYLSLIVD